MREAEEQEMDMDSAVKYVGQRPGPLNNRGRLQWGPERFGEFVADTDMALLGDWTGCHTGYRPR